MSKMTDIQVELKNAENDTLYGSLTIEGVARLAPNLDSISEEPGVEKDPQGAGAFVATVISVYAIAVVFLIASHVFVKKKEDTLDYQMRMVEKYWEESHCIKEIGARESFKKLKHSFVPAVAKSNARDLISRRKSFAPILANAGITLDADQVTMNGMPLIQEESDHEGEEEEVYTILPSTTVNYVNENGDTRKKEQDNHVNDTDPSKSVNGEPKRTSSGTRVSFSENPEYITIEEGNRQKKTSKSALNAVTLPVPEIHVTVSPFCQDSDTDTIEQEFLSTAAVNRAFQRSPVNVRVSPCEFKSDGLGDSLHPLAAEREYLLASFDEQNTDEGSRHMNQSPLLITSSPYSSGSTLDCFVSSDPATNTEGLYHVTF